MAIGPILKSILKLGGQRSAGQSTGSESGKSVRAGLRVEVIGSPHMPGKDYAEYCDAQRRDPAAIAWRNDPSAYRPSFRVSNDAKCPYCGGSLGDRKAPSRRSRFSCKNCGNVVFVDPWHQIFPSVYLNAKQGLIARCLGELNKSVSTAGKTEDFWWAAQQKEWLRGKDTLTDQEAADALWTLMNYNAIHMREILPPEEKWQHPAYQEWLQSVMRRFRDEEKEITRLPGTKRATSKATDHKSVTPVAVTEPAKRDVIGLTRDAGYEYSEDVISGLEFHATLKLSTPLEVLEHHGEVFNGPPSTAPRYGDDADGSWFPKADWAEVGLSEPPEGEVASDAGLVIASEYVVFLSHFRSIVERKCSVDEKLAALKGLCDRSALFARYWKALAKKYPGFPTSFFFRELTRVPGLGLKTAEGLFNAGFTTLAKLSVASEQDLLSVPGLGKGTVNKIREYFQEHREDMSE